VVEPSSLSRGLAEAPPTDNEAVQLANSWTRRKLNRVASAQALRRYRRELKTPILAECDAPGASVATRQLATEKAALKKS